MLPDAAFFLPATCVPIWLIWLESAFHEGYDSIVTEAAHGYLDKLAPRLAQCRTKQIIISHISYRANPPERVEALRAALPVPVAVAEDGQTFAI